MEGPEKDTRFVNELRDMAKGDGTAYLAEAESVEALTKQPGWGFLMDLLEARVQRVQAAIYAEGEPLSQAQYARKAGEVAGLRQVASAAETVLLVADDVRKQREEYAQREAGRQPAGV